MKGKLSKFTLDNGLRVVVDTDMSSSMVSMCITYDVGSRDEDPERTGFAHLFEHLMFGGSVNIPSYDEPLELAGGANNAFTTSDVTCFYNEVPWENLEVSFWLESDRMLSLAFTPESLEVQRRVVVEEFKETSLNSPYGDVSHLLRGLLYQTHPYQWPTIGKSVAHIEGASMEEVKSFFYAHYAPNSAVLALSGHVEEREARRLAEKWFGPIARRAVRKRVLPQEPEKKGQRRERVRRQVPSDAVFIAFPMVGCMDSRYPAFDIISDLLANGESARFNRRLKEKRNLFAAIDATVSGSADPGFFQVSGVLRDGVSIAEGEQAIFAEMEGLQDVKEEELLKVQSKFVATRAFDRLSSTRRAQAYSRYELLGGGELWDAEMKKWKSVTLDDVKRELRESLTRDRSVVLEYESEASGRAYGGVE